jgi:glycosyltransferase involved in cell wall biosynthesis
MDILKKAHLSVELDPAKLSILIPAYNEERRIAEVVRGVKRFVFRVLVVDDGSTDRTESLARSAGAEVIRQPVNRGKGSSLRLGFDKLLEEGSEAVIVLDGDGQHDPEEIPDFIRWAQESGAGIVIGNRMADAAGMPLLRYYTNRTMSRILSWLCHQEIPDSQCGYRLVRKPVIEQLLFTTGNYDTESEMLIQASRLGFSLASVPIRTIYSGQESRIHPGRDTLRFLRLVIRNIIFSARAKRIPAGSRFIR